MKRTLVIFAICVSVAGLPSIGMAQQKKTGMTKWPECYCTDRYGKRHELGEIICLTVDHRSYEAKCVMAQNNPFWRDLNRGCLSSSLPPNMSVKPTDVAALYQ